VRREGRRVVPLIGPVVDVDHHRYAGCVSGRSRVQCGSACRLVTETGSGDEHDPAVGDRCARDIVWRQRAIRAVVAVERERKLSGG
jgi:hypothetical protein